MKLTKDTNILIVGLGLIGGSYAMALSRKGYRVSAITKEQADVDLALSRGICVAATTEVDPVIVGSADLIIFALYPKIFLEWVEKNQHLFHTGAVITDVTGIKGYIVGAVQSVLRPDVEFIPAHPMAGRERSGLVNADDGVFHGANYIVTPTDKNTEEGIALCSALGRELGFGRVSVLPAEKHDEIIGFVSQLTHCIAISLMTCRGTEGMELYTGDSFRDLTRIARINDEMWSELFLLNRDALLHQIKLFEDEMEKLYDMIESGDREALREVMRYSTKRRDLFDKKTED